MKALILVLSMFAGLSASAAEFQLFVNYDAATKTYSEKLFSTTEAPLTAAVFMAGHAACYKGEVADVEVLFDDMIAELNFEAGQIATGSFGSFVGADGKTYVTLAIETKYRNHGRNYTTTYTYPQIRRCIR